MQLDKKIVFTNGCFDILHPGHMSYLKQARELGDWLVIGLNTDASIKRLKGPLRPIQNESTRKLMLESVKWVDEVILFDEDTPLELIKKIQPQVLVKGGDYKVEDIVGYNEVMAMGGVVKVLPFVEGLSTTKLIEKIIENNKKSHFPWKDMWPLVLILTLCFFLYQKYSVFVTSITSKM